MFADWKKDEVFVNVRAVACVRLHRYKLEVQVVMTTGDVETKRFNSAQEAVTFYRDFCDLLRFHS